ncbi:MAG: class II fructose-bisphosphate aldolase [Chloroflexota bacterium]
MPLITMYEQLKRAQREGWAVPLYDTADLASTEGMFAAMEAKRAPCIVAMWAGQMDRPNARSLASYIRTRAQEASVPVSLMLDHGASYEQALKAISFGFTDVMYDGSRLPMAENMATTRELVRAAHAMGVHVEAELGHVGRGSEYQSFGGQRKGFTDPATIAEFVDGTGVDFLAVAIGTAHGLYDGEPRIDLDLLRALRARVDIPLVMHGGTGCSEAQFRGAIAAGISKINVATDLFVTAGRLVAEAARKGESSYHVLGRVAQESFAERCSYYLELFGAAGKA